VDVPEDPHPTTATIATMIVHCHRIAITQLRSSLETQNTCWNHGRPQRALAPSLPDAIQQISAMHDQAPANFCTPASGSFHGLFAAVMGIC